MSSKRQTYKLEDLIEDACDTLDFEWDDIQKGHYELDDAIHEIADGAVPIYFHDIGQYASYNRNLMIDIPETGVDASVGAFKMIQTLIYEAICEGLYEHIDRKEKDEKQ